jgi:glycosyltransferase involved in cell wall biosynthesis
LRLAVVTPFIDRQHGTERALAELLDRLAREYGCEIHLYAERIQNLGVILPGDPPARSRLGASGSITWHRVPSIPGPHLFKFLFWIIANTVMRWWDRLARGLRVDLVLSPGINCLDADFIIVHAIFRRLTQLSRLKELSRDVFKEPPSQKPTIASQRISPLRRLHRRAYYAAVAALERIVYQNRKTHLAAVSRRTAELLGRYFGRNDVPVIYNGIDTVQFSIPARLARRQGARYGRSFSASHLVLLLIGNDWAVKGLPSVLVAMRTASDLPLRLLVVGSDSPQSFQYHARQLGIADRCRWESPRADVIDFYAAADIYVSPTLEDSFGLPVAEAMACGLPVITSKFAGVSELIQNNRDGFILAEPDNLPDLIEILRALHADPELRASLGASAATTAQSWTWDRNTSEIWRWLQSTNQTR